MVKALRVSHITMGQIHLPWHEATAATPRLGGHTIKKHVGRTEAQLRERLVVEPGRTMVSSFYNLRAAEQAISEVMRANAAKIKTWSHAPNNQGTKLTLIGTASGNVGYGVIRGMDTFVKTNKVKVILKHEAYNGMPFYVLTAYLIL
jgi:hypothetical protein